jgi:hypothetical protein
MLVPGVRQSIGVNNLPIDQISTVSLTINGQRASANEFLLDGAPNSAPSQNQPVIYANPDSVQEFKVDTNTFSAEYGRAAGGIFNVITKSGSNDPHFTLYEFFRNDQLNANDFFANKGGSARPPFKFNQFGGSIGGPVEIPKVYNGKSKTFFFGNFELVRFVQGITFTGTEPTAQQLAGDFTQTRNAAGAVIQIYDPLSTTAAAGGGFTRTVFPGNIIPANRINPSSAAISKFFPAPNTAGNLVTGVNNFSRTAGNDVTKNTWSTRIDHYFNERNRLFSRFSYDDTPFVRAAPYGVSNPGSPGTGPQDFNRKNGVIEDDVTLSPSLLAVFRYSHKAHQRSHRVQRRLRYYDSGIPGVTEATGVPGGLPGHCHHRLQRHRLDSQHRCRRLSGRDRRNPACQRHAHLVGASHQDAKPSHTQDGLRIQAHQIQHAPNRGEHAWLYLHERVYAGPQSQRGERNCRLRVRLVSTWNRLRRIG